MQRCQRCASVIGSEPAQPPPVPTSVAPSRRPVSGDTDGATRLRGGARTTTALAAEAMLSLPDPLIAVTTARSVAPRSAALSATL